MINTQSTSTPVPDPSPRGVGRDEPSRLEPDAASNTVYRLSPFVSIRPVDGQFRAETPFGAQHLTVSPALFPVLALLVRGTTTDELFERIVEKRRSGVENLVQQMMEAGWIEEEVPTRGETDASGAQRGEEAGTASAVSHSDALSGWDFYNVHAHARSRHGRFPDASSGVLEAHDEVAPAFRPDGDGPIYELTSPSTEENGLHVPLGEALAQRRTVRSYADEPLAFQDISDLLHHCCRVTSVVGDGSLQYAHRTYPSGGGLYPLEVYLIPSRCEQLPIGLYRYAPNAHHLRKIDAPTETLQRLLADAAGGGDLQVDAPPLLVCITARFGRMQPKYGRLSYSLILKEVGCLYQSMWLVGHALGLSACGLGTGNSDLFAEAAGTDYYEETTVGEFILGPRSRQSA